MSSPSFYQRDAVPSLYIERSALVAEEAAQWRKQGKVQPAEQDKFRIAAFGIDCQVGFCTPGASLFVPGAVEDTQRTIDWLYTNLSQITSLYFSLDTHRAFQIFHPSFWRDAEGNAPAPLTSISQKDVRQGRWTPIDHREACLEYCQKLEEGGRYVLTIWPYHTLLGGVSHALVPALMEAALFHSLARQSQTHFETKGEHPLTENYSVLSPEVHELRGNSVGCFQEAFLRKLLAYDRIYVFGQASSHCVLSTLRDIQEYLEVHDPSQLSKFWILQDATSPVPAPPLDPLPAALNFPAIAHQALEAFAKSGMHIAKTTDPLTF